MIEEGGMLAAGGLLTPGKVIGPNELWTGSPAKLRRVMDEEERKRFDRNAVGLSGSGEASSAPG